MVYRGRYRFDVSTDAGRTTGDMFRIAHDIPATNAFALQRILRAEGWRVDIQEIQDDKSSGES